MKLERFDVVLVDLPVQNATKDNPNTGKKIAVTGAEQHGLHPAVVVSADEDGQFAVVVPMTSAQTASGENKWQVRKKSWARVLHNGRYSEALCEQIRFVCVERIQKKVGQIEPQCDKDLILLKIQSLVGLI